MTTTTRLHAIIFPLVAGCIVGCGSSGNKHPIDDVPQTGTLVNAALSAPVDVVRDEWDIPHIYGETAGDVVFAQGYLMAQDRWFEMELARRQAEGTLAALVGGFNRGAVTLDIRSRMHHMRATAEQVWQMVQASSDPKDKETVQLLSQFSRGVNAYLDELRAGKHPVIDDLSLLYDPASVQAWSEIDSLSLAELQAFQLAFDSASELSRTAIDTAVATYFPAGSAEDARAKRAKLAQDLESFAPVDPTHTISGWTGMNGDTTTASNRVDAPNLLAAVTAAARTMHDVGNDHIAHPANGSNNWIVGPGLSASGHVLVANDTHLTLSNPPVFYFVHLVARSSDHPVNVMGVQFPGVPGVILGMNEHVAWGATTNYIDVTDIYSEQVVTCDDGKSPCVMFKGNKVALAPRQEKIDVGFHGALKETLTITLYDVPHHGPVIPRLTAAGDNVEALGQTELSVRYTGYDPAPRLLTAIWGLDNSHSMQEAVAALDSGFVVGSQNWVIGDDQGNFGWTQMTRVPLRAPTAAPFKVMPGDGTAEWQGDMDRRFIPHAYNPAQGFLATANNDPIGVTDNDDPFFGQPKADNGSPLYLGVDYDAGTRVGRITKRIQDGTSGGKKLGIDDLQSIQADAVSEYGQIFSDVLLDAATKLKEEADELALTPPPATFKYPELVPLLQKADAPAKSALPVVIDWLQHWSFDTPSGVAEDSPTPQQVTDSQAALVMGVWIRRFVDNTLEDELSELNKGRTDDQKISFGEQAQLRLMVRLCKHTDKLATGILAQTGDPVLFDKWDTPQFESKRYIAALSLFDALDFLLGNAALTADRAHPDFSKWRWGTLHTIHFDFLLPLPTGGLRLPPTGDTTYPNGFPRHGDIGTVDVGDSGLDLADYSYSHGPAIRFVAELDPQNGPRARNVLPGGQALDPASPHYSDLLELWRKNKTADLAFRESDVAASANKENAAHKQGRVHFTPR